MSQKLNNNTYQKNQNMSLIAQLIYKTGGIARADIARRLGLYRSSVTNIVGYLMEAGIVVEGEHMESNPLGGRRPTVLKMNRKFGFVAGVDLQPSHWRMTYHDIAGDLLDTEEGTTPALAFEDICDSLMERIISYSERTGLPLLGVGVGFPGIIDTHNGIVIDSEPMKLRNYDFYSWFRKKYDVPFLLENDANCSAWHQARKHPEMKSILVVLADYHEENLHFGDRNGIGIGLGLAINGEVYRGAHLSAGEFTSATWKEGCPGQTGFSEEYLSRMRGDGERTGKWVADVCNSLKTVCSVVDPAAIVFTGAPMQDEDVVKRYIKENASDFLACLRKYGIDFIVDTSHTCVAKGAAAMTLSTLFDTEHISCDWTDLMLELSKKKDYRIKES